jgi:hypothetical protein
MQGRGWCFRDPKGYSATYNQVSQGPYSKSGKMFDIDMVNRKNHIAPLLSNAAQYLP